MKIGIIGSGHIGGALAKLFTTAGHSVEIANSRGPHSLADLARSTGAKGVTVDEAIAGKDLLVVTIPMKAVPTLAGKFAKLPGSVPVIDTCNYYPRERDGRIAPIEAGLTESEWVAQQIGHPTIKAFNNISFKRLAADGRPKGDPQRIALAVSGDDPAQKRIVMDLIDAIGFDAIDNGPLSNSWRHQPGTPGYVSSVPRAEALAQLAAASPSRLPQFTAA